MSIIILDEDLNGQRRTMNVIYALHAVGLGLGAFGAASVVGSFLFGWPSIIAVILSYIQRDKVRGSWLASHIDWTLRTFWIALAWTAAVLLLSLPLMLVLVGFATLPLGLFLLGVWAIYRITRGWLRLRDGLAMPAE